MAGRNDASRAEGIKIYNRVFPYLMKRRTDSLVYHTVQVDMTKALGYIREKNRKAGERKYHIFDLIMAALVRTFALKPELNRFIARSEFWQRNEISFSFVVKRSRTQEGEERNAVVTFERDMVFEQVAAMMRETINRTRSADESGEERVLSLFFKLPKFLRLLTVSLLRFLDKHGRYPASLRRIDALHSSAFVANLGSINIPKAPYHHLYDWGTTSVFISFGKLERRTGREGQVKEILDFGITVDERIADGYAFMQAMVVLRNLLENPQLLEEPID